MADRNKIMWNADPLTDELSRQPSLDDDDIVGVDWGKVGKTALGVNHIVGKTLLKAIGMGGVADSMETLQNKGGALPDWATKSMKVSGPGYVVIGRGGKDPLVVNNAANVVVFGGKRFDGAGWQPGMPLGASFSIGVDSPTRVEISYKSADIMKAAKASSMTDASMIVFLGGDVSGNLDALDAPGAAAAQPAAGGMMGGMMGGMGGTKVSGMDEEDLETAVGTYSAYDIAANIFTGGLYAAGKKYSEKESSTVSTFKEPTRDAEADARIAAGKQGISSSKQRLADIQKQRAALRAARGRGVVTSTPVDTGDFARRLEVARQQIAASTGEVQPSEAQPGEAQPEAQAVLGELARLGIINDDKADEVLGMGFKWQYFFDPYAAVQDAEWERDHPNDTGLHFVEPVRDADVDARIAENTQQAADSSERLANIKKKIAELRAARGRRLAAGTKTRAVLGELSQLGIINSKGSDAMAHDDNELETEHDEELEAIMGDLGYVNIIGADDADTEIAGHYRTEIIGGRKRKAVKKPVWGGPGCADASKEGGVCDLMGSIDGNGSSYLMGCDILGADLKLKPTPRAGFVKRQTASGNTVLSLSTGKSKKGDHKSTYRNAVDVGTRAVSISSKLKNAIKSGGLKPAATKVKGYDEDEVLGAAPKRASFSATKPAPKGKAVRKLTHAQIKKIAENTEKAGKDLLAYAKKYGDQVKAHDAKLATASAATAKKMYKVKMTARAAAVPAAAAKPGAAAVTAKPSVTRTIATRVKGDAHILGYGDEDMLGNDNIYGDDVLGEVDILGDTSILGEIDILGLEHTVELLGTHFDILGEELAIMGDETAPVDAGVDPNAAPAVDPLADAVAAIGPAPTAAPPLTAGVDYMPDPYPGYSGADPNEYRGAELPLGALVFDNSVDLGRAGVGSANKFLSNGPANRRWGQDSGFNFDGDGWQTYDASNYKGFQWSHPNDGEMADLSAASMANGWGPLIGKPDSDMQGARWHVPTKQWFWFYDTAPAPMVAKLRAPGDLLRFNQAIAEYKTALTAFKTDQAAQAAADQLEAEQAAELAKQQAAEDAATARRQEKETSEAAHQAELQTKADEQAQATQSAIQAAQAAAYAAQTGTDTEAYKGQAQADVEAQSAYAQTQAEIDEKKLQAEEERTIRMAEKEAEFLAAHPEAGVPMDDGGGQGGEQGGGEEQYPDETSRELHEEAGTPEQYQDEADAAAMDQE